MRYFYSIEVRRKKGYLPSGYGAGLREQNQGLVLATINPQHENA